MSLSPREKVWDCLRLSGQRQPHSVSALSRSGTPKAGLVPAHGQELARPVCAPTNCGVMFPRETGQLYAPITLQRSRGVGKLAVVEHRPTQQASACPANVARGTSCGTKIPAPSVPEAPSKVTGPLGAVAIISPPPIARTVLSIQDANLWRNAVAWMMVDSGVRTRGPSDRPRTPPSISAAWPCLPICLMSELSASTPARY
jgi:hypothetical protein